MKSQLGLQAPDACLRENLKRILEARLLDDAQAAEVFSALADAAASPVLKAGVLAALAARGTQAQELQAFARALLTAAQGPIEAPERPLVDTCGTGGDGSGSFNVSSACAVLVASMGIQVAKHGNRSISSLSGSADFYSALGVPQASTPQEVQRSLARSGFAFLFAPHFHPAMAGLADVRRELGIRTLFNLLGPLVNPARPSHQLIGCTDHASARLLAESSAQLGVQRAFVVVGFGGWDEATPCGPFELIEQSAGRVTERRWLPEDFGLERCAPGELVGADAEHNAQLLRQLFAGQRGALRDAVLLNAALVLLLVEAAEEPLQAIERAGQAIDSGRAGNFLEHLTRGA